MRRLPSHLLILCCVLGGALAAASVASPSVGGLRNGISQATAREQSLSAGVHSASQLIGQLGGQLTVLGGRVSAVQAQLAAQQSRLAGLHADVTHERGVAARLHRRYIRQRAALGSWLVSVYEDGRPDALDVIMEAHGFSDLLERLSFLHRLSEAEGQVVTHTRAARAASERALVQLDGLTLGAARATAASAAESAALQSIESGVGARQAALASARQIELSQLHQTQAQRQSLQQQLSQQLAALAAPPTSAPTGSFTIPWPIVQCESGGQNLPPNSAGASGYYQILPATWKLYGGSTAQAYQAPKSEQDAVAARIWNGGAGAASWVCAGLVGGS